MTVLKSIVACLVLANVGYFLWTSGIAAAPGVAGAAHPAPGAATAHVTRPGAPASGSAAATPSLKLASEAAASTASASGVTASGAAVPTASVSGVIEPGVVTPGVVTPGVATPGFATPCGVPPDATEDCIAGAPWAKLDDPAVTWASVACVRAEGSSGESARPDTPSDPRARAGP